MERLFDDGEDSSTPVTGTAPGGAAPLAARLRPRTLDEVVGQAHLVGPDGALRTAIASDRLPSMILWGPPGTGKTSLARVIANTTESAFEQLSAVIAGVKDVRTVLERARSRTRRTVLFIDEIHRFNKAQQDALLPGVEDGTIVLIGATTENPSFEVNAPLLSRSLLYRLQPLSADDIDLLLTHAVDDERGLPGLRLQTEARAALVTAADGDGRVALTGLEAAAVLAGWDREGRGPVTAALVRSALANPHLRYDRADAHYDQVSAFIKSLRGSDPDAALYWLVRMLNSGEDPRFLSRRMVILAGEDVGLADPRALQIAVAAFQALEFVGLPEARYALAEAAVYLALAPKSNSVTTALARAEQAVARMGNAPVPAALRDAHYRGAQRLGHGVGYRYPHDDPRGWVEQRYLPEGLDPGDIWRVGAHGEEPDLERRRRNASGPQGAE